MKKLLCYLPILTLLVYPACSNRQPKQVSAEQPPWYKTSIIYNLDIDTFKDSNGDGTGDINGLTQKLDYLKWLGVDVIWLAPFQPTPDKDDGYDVTDYYGIDKRLGTKADFDNLIAQTKKRNIKVIMDLVLNHTSISHPWFKSAQADTNSKYFPFYVWSKQRPKDWNQGMGFPTVEKETWTYDSLSKHYYFHRFYTFQPDLNIENKAVQVEMKKILQYWLKQGVDGYRLDAVPFIVDIPRTSAKNPEHKLDFLTEVRNTVKAIKPDALLLGEANVTPDENIDYFGKQDERLQMMFNFYGNQYLFYAFASGNVKDFMKSLEDTKDKPLGAQWAYFLRNHDEIDLGRLPKEKLDQVYHKFAPDSSMVLYQRGIRRRLATMFSNNQQQLKMAYSLLFSLPGTPVIRYGEEIGMGDDLHLKERLSVRTPMQWSSSINGGFSAAAHTFRPVIDTDAYGFKKVSVETEQESSASLLSFIKQLITLRKQHAEIGVGAWNTIDTDNESVLAIKYTYGGKTLFAVHNLSSKPQKASIETDLKDGKVLVNVLSNGLKTNLTGSKVDIGLDGYGYKWYSLD